MQNPTTRLIEQEWQKIITRVRDDLVICPHCHQETLLDSKEGIFKCINCGLEVDVSKQLCIGTRHIYLTPGTKLYIDNDNVADGEVDIFPSDKNLYIIRNLAQSSWHIDTPSGKIKVVEPNDFMPVLNGLKISFGSSIKGSPNAKGEIKA